MNLKWFNFGTDFLHTFGILWKPLNAFNRESVDGHWWGFGILQIQSRHLFYVGDGGIWLFFVQLA
jgi:hypothetical protein